jgi:hypothetical protein
MKSDEPDDTKYLLTFQLLLSRRVLLSVRGEIFQFVVFLLNE